MDSLRNLTYRIRSCIPCDQYQCPAVRDRLLQHLLSHHSSSRSPKPSSESLPSRQSSSRSLDVPIINSDEHTSTSDIDRGRKSSLKQSYREALEREIHLWAKDLPKYPNLSAENLKQNLINELIEKVDSLKDEVGEDNYDAKLSREVSKFLDSLPSNSDKKKRDPVLDNRKKKLVGKINQLNKQTNKENRGKEKLKRPRIRNSGTNTTETEEEDSSPKSTATNTTQSTPPNRFKNKLLKRPKQDKTNDAEQLVDEQVHDNNYSQQPRSSQKQSSEIDENSVKVIISTWLTRVIKKSERNIGLNDKNVLTDVLFNRLSPLLSKQVISQKHKSLLKAEILNFLNDYFKVAVENNSAYFNKLVENLAITLLIDKSNTEASHSGRNSRYSFYCTDETFRYNTQTESYLRPIFYNIVKDALENAFIFNSESIENDITEILLHNIDRIRIDSHLDFKEDIHLLLKSSSDLTDYTIANIINVIMGQLSYVLCDNTDLYNSKENVYKPPWSNILSVYNSELELRGLPKNYMRSLQRYPELIKRSEPKLNAEERAYKELLSAVIAAWANSLPKKHNKAEDIILKETITNSLAIDILDQVKLEAVVPEKSGEKEKYFSFFIYRWLNRFEYFDDINNAKPYVGKLMKKLINIPMPIHGDQQMKKTNKFTIMTAYSPTPLMHEDMIKDEISEIINAQPSEIFIKADKEILSQHVHEFASDVQNSLMAETPTKLIANDIIQWLKLMIKPEEKVYFHLLEKQLAEKINSLAQKRLSAYPHQGRIRAHVAKDIQDEIINSSPCCELSTNNTYYEPENQFKEFIAIYIKHNYEVENSITREAFGYILKVELQKLCAPHTHEDYDNLTDNEQYIISAPESLSKELKYIGIISDWLKIVPLPTSYNRTENRLRIDMVNSLAKNINDVDKSKFIRLTGMDYNVYLASIINKYADQLPISTYDKKNMSAIVDALVRKIMKVRHQFCYQTTNFKNDISSINSINIPEEQLSSFIEEYIRENCEELSEDELRLEAISFRLFQEIIKIRSGNQVASNISKDHVEFGTAEEHLLVEESVKRLSFEMCYAKEISECLNNLPLASNIDKSSRELRVKMIGNLAERMYECCQGKNDDIYLDTDLSDYITLWISELPLDRSKQIDESIVIQQLLKRMERFNKRKLGIQAIPRASLDKNISVMCKFPYTCCNVTVSNQKNEDPGADIVEAIENWCAELPLETENENIDNVIKDNIATELYKKVSELNLNPKCFTDNILYRELFSEEVDVQLGALPQNSKLQKMKQDLKDQLVSTVMEMRIKMREQASSTEYKQELETTIELSLPNPVQTYQQESSGFKIYKDRLATLFILENFDHGYDNVKENYQKSIKKQIDKYFKDVQKRNTIPLSKDQIYNELYSALYNVPLPNTVSIAEEVEEIKTRCEIDNWFETLPLRPTSCTDKIFAKDQILAMLAKRIHRIEKYEQNPDSEILREITKWLSKFCFLPGQEDNVNQFARKLLQKLKSTSKNRKCTRRDEGVYIDRVIEYKNKRKGILGTSEIAGPSNEYDNMQPSSAYTEISSPSKPADIILNIVETWCEQLPLPENTPQEDDNVKIIKDNLVTKIIMKISELNVNHEIFNNASLYDALLDDELENLLSTLPISYEFNQSKQLRKHQLIDAVKSVKPLINKEKAKYEYKQELQCIVHTFLNEPQNITPKIRSVYNSLKDDIIDNFIIYNYYKNDEGGSFYKMMVNIAVDKYFTEVNEDKNIMSDPLMVGNHLLCEMAKVPVPGETAIIEEIEEIRIKFEITEFFNDLSLCNSDDKLPVRNQIISTLAKRINVIAKNGYTPDNLSNMKNEIMKRLTKLDENVHPEKVDALVERIINLPKTETSRKSESKYVNPFPDDGQRFNQSCQTPVHQRYSRDDRNNQNTDDTQWLSLPSVTPNAHDSDFNETKMNRLENNNLEDIQRSQFSGRGAEDMERSKLNYSDFKRGTTLFSSVREDQETNDYPLALNPRSHTPNNQEIKMDQPKSVPYIVPNQDREFMQNSSLQPSSSLNKSIKAGHSQQNIEPSNALITSQSPCCQQNQLRQGQTLPDQESQMPSEFPSATPDNRSTQFPPCQNQTTQKENVQPLEKITHQDIPQQFSDKVRQQVPQQVSQKLPTLVSSDNNIKSCLHEASTPVDKQGTTAQEKSQISAPQPTKQENPSSSSPPNRMSKTSIQFKKVREPKPLQSFTSNVKMAPPKTLISESNAQCGKRRPSILFFDPSDVKSESMNSTQCPRTNEKKVSTQRLPSNREETKVCKCGNKWKRLCKSEIPICRAHKKKGCRTCTDLSPFYFQMPPCRYPGFYFY